MLVLLLSLSMAAGAVPAQGASGQDDHVPRILALIEAGLYQNAEAVASEHLQHVVDTAGAESIAAVDASDLYIRTQILNGHGGLPNTVSAAERTLQLRERLLGATASGVVPSIVNRGQILFIAGRYPDAITTFQRAVALAETGPRVTSADLIAALDGLGRVLDRAGRQDEALVVLRRCVALEEAEQVSARERAKTLQALGAALQTRGAYGEARVQLERAMTLHDQAGSPHAAAVDTVVQLGNQLWFEGKLIDARVTHERAVALAGQTLQPDHPTTALALRKLAADALDLGDVAAARSSYERALGIVERSLGPEHVEAAAILNGLANSNMQAGDYPAARRQYERALVIARAQFGERHDWVATFIHNLAIVDTNLGDFAAARREFARAIAIWEAVYGPDHPVVAVALFKMAAVWRKDGSPAAAIPLLERALAIRTRSLGPDHRDVARTLADLASTLDRTGQTTRARELVARALSIFDAMPDPPALDLAAVLTLSAELQVRAGDYAAARSAYVRARDIRMGLLGPSHPLVAETEAGLAMAQAGSGDRADAFATAATAEASGREHLRLTLRYLPERESLIYQRNRPRGLDLMLSVALDAPDLAAPALDAVIRSRALVFDELMNRRRVDATEASSLAAAEKRLDAARQRVANLIVRGFNSGDDVARQRSVLDAAQRESEEAERDLAASSAVFRAERERSQIGLADVEAALPADTALVSFLRFDRVVYPAPQPAGNRAPASVRRTPSYAGFVLRPGRQPVVVALGPVDEIDRLLTEWRAQIASEAGDEAIGDTGPSRAAGVRLRRRIWDPLQAAIGDPRRVFIVPDGAISLVPFAALPVGARSFLIETAPSLHYLTAERDVEHHLETSAVGKGLLAIGGAAFGSRPAAVPASTGCADVTALQFDQLDGSLEEARQIARIWTSAFHDPGSARILSGDQAREETFKRDAPGSRVLHLATHGFFLSGDCQEQIRGTRSVGGLVSARPADPSARPRNDTWLSALAFARANARATVRGDQADGILVADEVAALQLTGVEWAVLSACDTGLGRPIAGEGVLGLQRAFQLAGVHTVIMTLWPVDDRATGALMRELYTERFVKGLASDEAMRGASLSVLRARRAAGESTHPFFWAAFVATGDWR